MPNGEAVTNEDTRKLLEEIETLKRTLESYTHCRHGSIGDACGTEARAALYPYLKMDMTSSKIAAGFKK